MLMHGYEATHADTTNWRLLGGPKLHSTLILLVPFSYKLMHHLKPFAIVVLNGEITVYSVDSPNGFEWRSVNTKPCLDLSKS